MAFPTRRIKQNINFDLNEFKKKYLAHIKNKNKTATIHLPHTPLGPGPAKRPLEPFPEKVCIIGAGAAGLYSGLLLDTMNINFTILEKDGKVGGRLDTYYFGGDLDLWADLGAMRIPTAVYQNRLLKLIEYLNSNLPPDKSEFKIDLIPFDMSTNYLYVNDIKKNYTYALDHPDELGFGFPPGYNPSKLYEDAIAPLLKLMELNQIDELLKYDTIPFRSYMLNYLQSLGVANDLAQSTVNFLELVYAGSNEYNLSIIEQILDEFEFTPTPQFFPADTPPWRTIKHGLNRLAVAFTQLKSKTGTFDNHIQYNCEVTKIKVMDNQKLQVTYKRSSGLKVEEVVEVYDRIIISAPFNYVRFWELPEFSLLKRTAIRKLHYGEAAKVYTLHNERFWEQEGIKGGVTYSDIPARVTLYNGFQPPKKPNYGVLLDSYTWDTDAIRFSQFTGDQAAAIVLKNMDKIDRNTKATDTYTGQNVLKVWESGYALFEPGQFANCYPEAFDPEFRVHFAGEHTSMFHAWVIGALNSSYRVVHEILTATAPEKLKEFETKWPKYVYDD